jgi:hypothetical protein
MNRVRLGLLVTLAVFVATTVGAAAAEATEGPFSKIEGTRLLAGEKHATAGSTSKEYVFKAGTIEIKSKKSKLKGANFLGSTGANAGSSEGIVEFEENTVVGNGTGCKVGTIQLEPATGVLGFANKERTGTLFIFFKPVKGTVFVTITFTGTCTVPSTTVAGSVAAEAFSSTSGAVVVGSEPATAEFGEVNFPATSIKSAFTESGGTLTEVKPKLEAFGLTSTLVGRSKVGSGLRKGCVSTGATGSKC